MRSVSGCGVCRGLSLQRKGVLFLTLLIGLVGIPRLCWSQQAELKASLDSLLEQHADDPAQRAQALADWMTSHDWQSLPFRKQVGLLRGLDRRGGADQEFAVRWTGFLTAPADGDYHFEQLRSYRAHGGVFRVWLDEQLVLDSTANSSPQTVPTRSGPISLVGGQPVALRAEFVRGQQTLPPQLDVDRGISQPTAALLWESDQLPQQLIPAGAYSLPTGFESTETDGLKAEYFSDVAFGQPLLTRRDASMDLMTRVDFSTDHLGDRETVRQYCRSLLDDTAFLNKYSGANAAKFLRQTSIHRLVAYGSVQQRVELRDWLLARPQLLAAADTESFGDLFIRVAVLPGNKRTQLLRVWSEDRPVPPCSIAFYPDGYKLANVKRHRQIGRWLRGPYSSDLDDLVANDLSKPNGHCRVELAAIAAHASVLERGGWFGEQIRGRLADDALVGDARASWLIGLAFVEEALAGIPVRPQLAIAPLQEASLVATSNEMKFQVIGQLVPRMISLGRFAEGRALLDQWDDQFTSQEQQETIAQWRANADKLETELEQHIAERKAEFEEQRRLRHIATIQARLERAEQRGDTALVSRYQEMIRQATPPQE